MLGLGVGLFLIILAGLVAVAACAVGALAEKGCAGCMAGTLVLALVVAFLATAPREAADTAAAATATVEESTASILSVVLLLSMVLGGVCSAGAFAAFKGVVPLEASHIDDTTTA